MYPFSGYKQARMKDMASHTRAVSKLRAEGRISDFQRLARPDWRCPRCPLVPAIREATESVAGRCRDGCARPLGQRLGLRAAGFAAELERAHAGEAAETTREVPGVGITHIPRGLRDALLGATQ